MYCKAAPCALLCPVNASCLAGPWTKLRGPLVHGIGARGGRKPGAFGVARTVEEEGGREAGAEEEEEAPFLDRTDTSGLQACFEGLGGLDGR